MSAIDDRRDWDDDMMKMAGAFFDNLQIDDCEYGGIGLDCKRPFGNSYVQGDILEIIGEKPAFKDCDGYDSFSPEQEDYADSLYGSLIEFLQQIWEKFNSAR